MLYIQMDTSNLNNLSVSFMQVNSLTGRLKTSFAFISLNHSSQASNNTKIVVKHFLTPCKEFEIYRGENLKIF